MINKTTTPAPLDRSRFAGVYLLTPDADATDFKRVLAICDAALDAGVSVFQYRNKRADPATRSAQARQLVALAHRGGALVIVNDDVDLALESGADGVHLGRDDGDLARARARLPHQLLGASCYDQWGRAEHAIAAGADAVAFGSVFVSPTKPAAVRAPLALVTKARRAWPATRVVAIGGIGVDNIAAVAEAGAHAAALMSAVFDSTDPAQAARALVQQFKQGLARDESQRTAV